MNVNKLDEFKEQNVILKNRKSLELSGVNKLESMNPNEFVVFTVLGKMIIKGKDLEMQALDIDNGHLSISGNVNSMEYLDKLDTKDKKGLFSKLFK